MGLSRGSLDIRSLLSRATSMVRQLGYTWQCITNAVGIRGVGGGIIGFTCTLNTLRRYVQGLGDELSLQVVVRRTDNSENPAPVPMHWL